MVIFRNIEFLTCLDLKKQIYELKVTKKFEWQSTLKFKCTVEL